MTQTSYKLYAMKCTPNSLELAREERFSRITPGYVLIYTSEEVNHPNIEIPEEKTTVLSKPEQYWLMDCNAEIIAEETQKHKPVIIDRLTSQINELEKALKREKEKSSEGGVSDEQHTDPNEVAGSSGTENESIREGIR